MSADVKGWLGLLARLLVGAVWIWAGAIKLPDPTQSVIALRAYQLVPSAIGVLTRGAGVLPALLLSGWVARLPRTRLALENVLFGRHPAVLTTTVEGS